MFATIQFDDLCRYAYAAGGCGVAIVCAMYPGSGEAADAELIVRYATRANAGAP